MTPSVKKEFITTWSKEEVWFDTFAVAPSHLAFFGPRIDRDTPAKERMQMIIPVDISFNQLAVFQGFKTKITIEVIPYDAAR